MGWCIVARGAMTTAALLVVYGLLQICYAGKDRPVFSEEIKEIIQSVHDECVGKTGVAEEDITNCENGIFKEDVKLKCYMFCLLEEASLADEDGTVDYDMLVSLIPEEYYDRTTHMIFSCKHLDTPDKDKCQRAFEVHKCSYQKDPDVSKTKPYIQKLKLYSWYLAIYYVSLAVCPGPPLCEKVFNKKAYVLREAIYTEL